MDSDLNMANEKAVNYVVEFDGTGSPTGVAWLDGERFTFTASSLSLRMPPTSGKTTDKYSVAVKALITGPVAASVTIVPIAPDGKVHSSISHAHA